jgi:hypothetical protein
MARTALPVYFSKPVENKFSHRTLTHSLLAIVFIWSIAVIVKFLFFTGNFNPLAFAIGYTSHILIDCASVQGVKILYPFSMRNAVFPFDTQQPEAYRIIVGSKADVALGFVFVFLTIPFAYISFKTHTKIVREFQRDINSAVRSYNELSKNFICWARLEGINTTTGDKLEGRLSHHLSRKTKYVADKRGLFDFVSREGQLQKRHLHSKHPHNTKTKSTSRGKKPINPKPNTRKLH